MKLNYIKSQSSVKPDLIDTTSSKTSVYIRRNIIEKEKVVENTDSENGNTTSTVVFYEYDEAKLTKEEYQEYLKELEITDTLEIIENLKTENQALSAQVDMLTNCVLEMSEVIYN